MNVVVMPCGATPLKANLFVFDTEPTLQMRFQ